MFYNLPTRPPVCLIYLLLTATWNTILCPHHTLSLYSASDGCPGGLHLSLSASEALSLDVCPGARLTALFKAYVRVLNLTAL